MNAGLQRLSARTTVSVTVKDSGRTVADFTRYFEKLASHVPYKTAQNVPETTDDFLSQTVVMPNTDFV